MGLDGEIENSVYSSWRIDLIPTPCPWKGQLLVFSFLMSRNREKNCYTLLRGAQWKGDRQQAQVAARTIPNRYKEKKSQWQLSESGTGFPERLWSLHPSKYGYSPKQSNIIWHYFGQGVVPPEVPPNLNYSIFTQSTVLECNYYLIFFM